MAKRFTDTEKYKKAFIKTLPGPYKLLWDYLNLDCDHAGIWHKDFEVAQIRIGSDMPINESLALQLFNKDQERVRALPGEKWFVIPFVSFQYGEPLNPENRLHLSVLTALQRHDVLDAVKVLPRALEAPTEGAKDKEKEKDKVKERGEDWRGGQKQKDFDLFWQSYPKRRSKGAALKAWRKLNPTSELVGLIVRALEQAKTSTEWVKDGGQYIPNPATWLNAMGWEDEHNVGMEVPNWREIQLTSTTR